MHGIVYVSEGDIDQDPIEKEGKDRHLCISETPNTRSPRLGPAV